MKKRLPEHNVKCYDEIANDISNVMRLSKNAEDDELQANKINEYASLDRQYTGGYSLSNDQRLGEIYLGFRSVMGLRKRLLRKEEICKPALLIKILNKLKTKVLKQGENCTLKLSEKCKKLETLIKKIGFLKIYYIEELGQEDLSKKEKQELKQIIGINNYVLAVDVPFSYKHRAKFVEYPALGKNF